MTHLIICPFFIWTIFILAALYYPTIILVYFRKEIKAALKSFWNDIKSGPESDNNHSAT